jgi:hypothetical protein
MRRQFLFTESFSNKFNQDRYIHYRVVSCVQTRRSDFNGRSAGMRTRRYFIRALVLVATSHDPVSLEE